MSGNVWAFVMSLVSATSVETALDEKLGEAEARISSIKANAMKEVSGIAEDTTSAIVEALFGGKASRAEIAAAVKSVAG